MNFTVHSDKSRNPRYCVTVGFPPKTVYESEFASSATNFVINRAIEDIRVDGQLELKSHERIVFGDTARIVLKGKDKIIARDEIPKMVWKKKRKAKE